MDEMMLAGIFLIISALPGLLFGFALLIGIWRPKALREAADPDGLRRTVGGMILSIGTSVVALGLALLLVPRPTVIAALPYAIAAIVLLAILLTVRAIRKQKR